ncbi:MAG: DUF261 domain-containing protein [Treponema sp.]|jgi:hypothetical protein|nr:DUF261 domain-containing protein [Treponema sp.]
MKQGIQKDFPEPTLASEGCYFFCLLRWAEILRDKEFTVEQIKAFFICSQVFKLVDEEATVLQPTSFLNWLIDRKSFTSYSKPKEKPHDQDIYGVYLSKPKYDHYVLSAYGEIWDPLDPDRPQAKDYKTVGYRVIT